MWLREDGDDEQLAGRNGISDMEGRKTLLRKQGCSMLETIVNNCDVRITMGEWHAVQRPDRAGSAFCRKPLKTPHHQQPTFASLFDNEFLTLRSITAPLMGVMLGVNKSFFLAMQTLKISQLGQNQTISLLLKSHRFPSPGFPFLFRLPGLRPLGSSAPSIAGVISAGICFVSSRASHTTAWRWP